MITRYESGVKPLLLLLAGDKKIPGAVAADKIVGKAAAFLFVLLGVKKLHAVVLSRSAMPILDKYGVEYSYDTLTEMIINRQGSGPCPMEEAVAAIDEPIAAYKAICERVATLAFSTQKD